MTTKTSKTNKKNEDLRFDSAYGGGKISPAQYIIELICAKKANFEKKTLSYKFWTDPEWSVFFKRWMRQAHTLLRKYEALAIINALNDEKSGMKWSLHTEFMLNLIKQHQHKINQARQNSNSQEMDEELLERIRSSRPREQRRIDTVLDRLDVDTSHLDIGIIPNG